MIKIKDFLLEQGYHIDSDQAIFSENEENPIGHLNGTSVRIEYMFDEFHGWPYVKQIENAVALRDKLILAGRGYKEVPSREKTLSKIAENSDKECHDKIKGIILAILLNPQKKS